MSRTKKIAVLGFMANCPIAGVVWQHLHYIVGLQRLGHEVYYIEDTSRYPYDPVQQTPTDDYSYAAGNLARLAAEFGFEGRWAFAPRYKSLEETAGLSRAFLNELYGAADALLNICGSHELNDDLLRSERIIYVESDPAVEQIKVDQGNVATTEFLARHCARFTFGESVGQPEFPVPLHGLTWLPTRQPVVTDLWRAKSPSVAGARFTSIANLATGGKKDIVWRGENYIWSKLPEFNRFRNAPKQAGEAFELATHFNDAGLRQEYFDRDWNIVPPDELSIDHNLYLKYIRDSKGEFTVAKDQYVRLHTGWFSDRSACYLAAGRPVITQQTGFTRYYGGSGRGLFAFQTMEEVTEAVSAINADYALHSAAAAEIAREFFEAETVLSSLLARAGV